MSLSAQDYGFSSSGEKYRLAREYNDLLLSILKENDSLRGYAKILQSKALDKGNLLYETMGKHILKNAESNLLGITSKSLLKQLLVDKDANENTIKLLIDIGKEEYAARDFTMALDFYLAAYHLAHKLNNTYLVYLSTHGIGILKARIGDFGKAAHIHISNLKLFEEGRIVPYKARRHCITLFSLSNSFRNLNQVLEAKKYNQKGKNLASQIEDNEMENLFLQHQAMMDFSKSRSVSDTEKARDSLLKSAKYFEKHHFDSDLAFSYFYLGRINDELKNRDQAINYFNKVDSVFTLVNDIHPETVPAYTYLINYHKEMGNREQQLYYINRRIKVDSVVKGYRAYLDSKIALNYDFPNILEERNKIVVNKAKREKGLIFIVVSMAALLFGYDLRQKRLKKQFEKILLKDTLSKKNKRIDGQTELSSNTVSGILEGLYEFEKNEQFKDKSLSLSVLAKRLNTNSSYLSKVVNREKNKNFSHYLNELRMAYVLKQLKESKRFRNYKVSAIAREAGFRSTQTFSKLFRNQYGMNISNFIKQLNEEIDSKI